MQRIKQQIQIILVYTYIHIQQKYKNRLGLYYWELHLGKEEKEIHFILNIAYKCE